MSPRSRNRTWLIKYYFFVCKEVGETLKEIGERLKETRESIGISMEEAAEDLKMRISQIEDIEAGNMESFKDIFYLKYFIRDYAKYLGLDYEDMVDEFNEYLFDYTSKISIEDIKKAKKNASLEEKKEEKRISSPYTVEHSQKIHIPRYIIYLFVILLIVIAAYFGIQYLQEQNQNEDRVVAMNVIEVR